MATSVPVPIARPRSAWASAGASLTPSPTIATTRPSACRRRMTSALSAGRTSAMTSSMPTSAATARAVVSLSPVSSTGRRPSAFSDATASAERRLDGVGDDEDRGRSAVPAGGDRGLAARLGGAAGGVELGREVHRPVGQQRGPADDQRVAVDDALDAEALAVGEALDRRAAGRSARPRPAMAWAIGCSEACSSAPTSRSASSRSTPSATVTSTRLILPVVTVPVLSSTIGVDAAGGLEDLAGP